MVVVVQMMVCVLGFYTMCRVFLSVDLEERTIFLFRLSVVYN